MTDQNKQKGVSAFLKKYGLSLVLLLGLGWWYYTYKVVPDLDWSGVMAEVSEGASVNADNLIEGPAIVHFYASWCGPCMAELPALSAFSQNNPELKIILFTDDPWSRIESISEQYGLSISRVNDMSDLGVHSIPVTYLVGKNGEILHSHLGVSKWGESDFQLMVKRTLNNS